MIRGERPLQLEWGSSRVWSSRELDPEHNYDIDDDDSDDDDVNDDKLMISGYMLF